MTVFTTSRSSRATLDSDRAATWDALTDPGLLARLTPFLREVRDLGDGRWRWELARIPYPGSHFSAAFTERMVLTDRERIEFRHEPPAGATELAGAEGSYTLTDRSDGRPGTEVAITLAVSATLPVPAWGRRAVVTAMDGVLKVMGDRFSSGLVAHLAQDPGARA